MVEPEEDELDEELVELELDDEELLLEELEPIGSVTPPHATTAEAHTITPPNFRARQSSDSDRILSIVLVLCNINNLIKFKSGKAHTRARNIHIRP